MRKPMFGTSPALMVFLGTWALAEANGTPMTEKAPAGKCAGRPGS